MTMAMDQQELSTEQRLMHQTTRDYVAQIVIPFIRTNREREWLFDPDKRLPKEILEEADAAGLRWLGVPVQYGGVELDPGTEAQTFALIATELGRGDAGLADKLAQGWKGVGAPAARGSRASTGALVPPLHGGPVVSHGPLPDRTEGGVGSLAAVQRPGSEHGHPGHVGRRSMDDQRPEAVHQQRVRRLPVRRLCEHEYGGRDAAGDEQLPRPARHTGADRHPLQRDDRWPLHEQRRDRLRGLPGGRGSSAGAG